MNSVPMTHQNPIIPSARKMDLATLASAHRSTLTGMANRMKQDYPLDSTEANQCVDLLEEAVLHLSTFICRQMDLLDDGEPSAEFLAKKAAREAAATE